MACHTRGPRASLDGCNPLSYYKNRYSLRTLYLQSANRLFPEMGQAKTEINLFVITIVYQSQVANTTSIKSEVVGVLILDVFLFYFPQYSILYYTVMYYMYCHSVTIYATLRYASLPYHTSWPSENCILHVPQYFWSALFASSLHHYIFLFRTTTVIYRTLSALFYFPTPCFCIWPDWSDPTSYMFRYQIWSCRVCLRTTSLILWSRVYLGSYVALMTLNCFLKKCWYL